MNLLKNILIISSLIVSQTVSAQPWLQVGQDIDGEAASDGSGRSVSLSSDGSTVAIGASRNDGNGSDAGHVRIYKNISGTWIQQGSDIDGEAAGDWSGESVSLSSDGSIVAIAAPNNDARAGHVRVYKNINGTWTQQGSDIDGEAAGDNWVYASVSLSSDGSIVAIGAQRNDGNGADAGHVRIYKNINGTWTQQGSDIDGEAAGDLSGSSVSLSSDGSIVAIGAWFNEGNGSRAGHVRVYKNINGTWTQQGSDIDGEAVRDYSGSSVSLSSDGSTVAIGAYQNDGNGGSNSGHVRIYKNISGTWTQQGSDIDGEAANDCSGYSVSLSSDGSTVAIGAHSNAGNGRYAGHVRIYKNISGTWTQQGSDIDGEAAGDRSGWSVSLSSDGSIVAIGAYGHDGNGSDAGHVRIYDNKAYRMHKPKFMHGTILSPSDTAYSCTGLDTIIINPNILGTFPVGTQFNYELSDETGSFANPKVSDSTSNRYFNDTFSIPVISLLEGHYGFRIKNNLSTGGQWYESSNVLTILKRPNSPIIKGDSLVANYCDQQIISAKLPSGTNKLKWTYDGSIVEGNIVDTITSITISNDGIYTLSEYNQGCEADTSLEFFRIKPVNQSICMVTIDSTSGSVQLLWEKNDTFATAFKVYRETSQIGIYERLKSKVYSDYSSYTDTVANPLTQSYTYRLTTFNVCEDSTVSMAHSTVHLSSNEGVNGEHNLYWTKYKGFPVSTYEIYNNNKGAGFKKIAEVNGDNNTYSVLKPASGSNVYVIRIEHPTGCKPSKRTESSISNSVMIGTAGMNEVKKYLASVYPNPVNRILNVKCNASLLGLPYIIVSTTGKEIYSGVLTHQTTNIDIQDLPLGIYFLKIGNGINQAYRFIKN